MSSPEEAWSGVRQFLANPEQSCCYFPFSLQELVHRAIAGLYEFLEESEEKKRLWTLHIDDTEFPDDGYIKRSGMYHRLSTDVQDRKEFFHYRPVALAGLRHMEQNMYLRHSEWLEKTCYELLTRCVEEVAMPFARAFDVLMPGYALYEQVLCAANQHKLRLVAYDVPNGNSLIAVPHFDKSALTLHIGESHPGLHIGTPGRLIETQSEKAFLFPGRRMQLMTGGTEIVLPEGGKGAEGGYIKALSHHARYEGNERRWAAIVFIHI